MPIIGLLAVTLVAAASPPVAAMPSRAEVEAALNAWWACGGPPNLDCDRPVVHRLTRARCIDERNPIYPGRVLCFFDGSLRGVRARVIRVRHSCGYFGRDARGRWRLDAYPDADVCEG